MNPFEQLGLIAEISATLLGFVAVFVALSNDKGRFLESDRHFIQGLVLTSILGIVLGLTPGTLSTYLTGQAVWEASLIVALAGAAVVTVLTVWEQWNMSAEESSKVHWLWHVPPWVLSSCATILLLLAFFNESYMMAFYVGGTSLMVPVALWCFVSIVFRKYF